MALCLSQVITMQHEKHPKLKTICCRGSHFCWDEGTTEKLQTEVSSSQMERFDHGPANFQNRYSMYVPDGFPDQFLDQLCRRCCCCLCPVIPPVFGHVILHMRIGESVYLLVGHINMCGWEYQYPRGAQHKGLPLLKMATFLTTPPKLLSSPAFPFLVSISVSRDRPLSTPAAPSTDHLLSCPTTGI